MNSGDHPIPTYLQSTAGALTEMFRGLIPFLKKSV